jgi:hypothetical protein
MSESVTVRQRDADFQRAVLGMRYFFGARGDNLSDGFAGQALAPAAADVLAGLTHESRERRAMTLALELARLSAALDQQGLWR